MLKQRVRDHIDPKRDLGHSDRGGKKKSEEGGADEKVEEKEPEEAETETSEKDEQKSEEQAELQERVNKAKEEEDGNVCTDCA